MRNRRPYSYSEDSDVETEKKDKIFANLSESPLSSAEKFLLLLIVAALAVVLLLAHQLSLTAILPKKKELCICSEFGKSLDQASTSSSSNFQFLALFHFSLREKDMTAFLSTLSEALQPGDKLILGLTKIRVPDFNHNLDLIEHYFSSKKNTNEIILCHSQFEARLWKGIVQKQLIKEDFILFEGLESMQNQKTQHGDQVWRDWLKKVKILFPDQVISLQEAHMQDTVFLQRDGISFHLVNYLSTFSATFIPIQTWNIFLHWFETHEDDEFDTFRYHQPGWNSRPLGHYYTWAKAFTIFLSQQERYVIHPTTALAKSSHLEFRK